jgi:hypothetical protein
VSRYQRIPRDRESFRFPSELARYREPDRRQEPAGAALADPASKRQAGAPAFVR